MAYYNNEVAHFDGRLVLYQRSKATKSADNASKPFNWYMRIKIEGKNGKLINKSTKHSVYEEAYLYAVKEYQRIWDAVKTGRSIEAWTFDKHWQDWFQRNVDNGNWRPTRVTWHENYYNRYFGPYFRTKNQQSMLLDDIDYDYAQRYFEWRVGYWHRAENAKLLNYNPKRRGLKTQGTKNAVKTPAYKTLLMEQSALNQIFFDAVSRNRTTQRFRLKAPNSNNGDGQRAGFDADEYKALYTYLESYRDAKGVFKAVRTNKWHMLMRQQLYCFVIFLANSGLRVGEARMMKWSDVKLDIPLDDGTLIAEVRVSQHTKKRKVRYVQVQRGGNKQLKDWQQLSPNNEADDWVWFSLGANNEFRQFGDLNKNFQTILKQIPYNDREDGLLYDNDGKRRSLYSLRHVYADLRLENGVSIENLAKNMGTMVKQIELHYSHRQTRDAREDIAKMKRKPKKTAEPNDFVSEALQRFKDGKLSEAALREILGSS